jgi:DNA-binding response OmpR family regulator
MDRRRVLVVEDEKNIRDLVCLHLGLEGYECVPVGDAGSLLRRRDRSISSSST